MKRVLALGAVAVALGGCAAGYYDGYGYGGYGYGNDAYGYDAYGNPAYSGPAYDNYYYGQPWYSGPSGSLGFFYFDNGGSRHWRERDPHGSWSDHRADGNNGRWPGDGNRGGNWVERHDDRGGPGAGNRGGNGAERHDGRGREDPGGWLRKPLPGEGQP